MANQNPNQAQSQASQTNAQRVRQQNAASAQGQNTEFASETDAQQVRQQNQQSEQRKRQQSSNNQAGQ
ncbi:gamma-type small acid-soluble spore protein [Desertibacillus haloalkaliphilus]|uniref:gamma-type small acid-soluble spore protein n=1 Tax=Desertibacillus haloalkaliphilus TaxID=1328930 RepID=UPI001C275F47|nr:gamma-type small acid-soluble spore protein [Desertibacillus haloalkaliphilus]MBU8908860.1 gamma-type small acid-soluble spore protein [Desertibacillus haloalkaliphilus]